MSGDAPADFSGNTVGAGRYQLRNLLGEGGMASVHVGHDTVLDRPVAIKTLHSELGREASFRERFRREAQAVARLNHTNIVSVYDSGEDLLDGRSIPYIVMELVDGDPLRTVLDRDVAEHGAMPADRALHITADVLAALSASHEMALVHRDIKPGNVMLTRRGVVKVMDFGIARALQSGVTAMTQTGMVVGTPQYLSPEQALGRGVDERSDLYSVGCMLFELVTGRLPFEGDSALAVAYQHVQSAPPVPSDVNRSLPPAVDALVARALMKDPADRFPSADAMREECRRVAALTSGGATPLVIGEGPRVRHHHPGGAGPDAFAVFPPPAEPHTPQPPRSQPYQPAGSGSVPPGPPPQGSMPQGPPQGSLPPQAPPASYGPPSPPPTQPAGGGAPGGYGYPGGPAPGPQHLPQGYPTAPAGPAAPRRGGNWRPFAIFSVIAVVAVLVLLGVLGALTDKKDNGSQAGGGTPTPQPSVTLGDPSRTIDPSQCTGATNGFSANKNDVLMPDLTFKYIDSVRACVQDAGWRYRIRYQDEHLWGKGTVINQSPAAISEFNPKKTTITLYVSTGKFD